MNEKLTKKRNNLLESILVTEMEDCLEKIKLMDEFLEKNKEWDIAPFREQIISEILRYKKFSNYCKDAEFETINIKNNYQDLLNKYNLN